MSPWLKTKPHAFSPRIFTEIPEATGKAKTVLIDAEYLSLGYHYPHFTDEDTEAQRDEVPCPQLYNKVAKMRFKPVLMGELIHGYVYS